jgi:hypothetical protein
MTNDIEIDLYRILSGKLIFSYQNKEYELRNQDSLLKYKANLIFQSIINDEKYNDWIRAEYLDNYMTSLGIWNQEMSLSMKNSEKVIDDLKVSLYGGRFNSKQTEKTRKNLASIRNRIGKLSETRSSFYANTLEGYADSIKYEYLITNTIYCNNQKVFPDLTSTQNSYTEFTGLITEINKYFISVATYRKIARSELWRTYWSLGKEKVFGKAVEDWTDEQRSLASFSTMYDSIYNHPEKPTDSVINDDDCLDGWMILQHRNVEKTKQQEQMTKNSPQMAKAQEIFVFTDSQEGIEQVMEMNSSDSMAIMKERFRAVEKVGEIDQLSLPDIYESSHKT